MIPDKGAATPALTVVGAGLVLWDTLAPMGAVLFKAAAKGLSDAAKQQAAASAQAAEAAASNNGSGTSSSNGNGTGSSSR
jgi:hypothetical protein